MNRDYSTTSALARRARADLPRLGCEPGDDIHGIPDDRAGPDTSVPDPKDHFGTPQTWLKPLDNKGFRQSPRGSQGFGRNTPD